MSHQIKVTHQGNITSYTIEGNPIQFSSTRFDRRAFQKIQRDGVNGIKGLDNSEEVAKFLRNEDYCNLLRCIWSEEDIEKRINFLRHYAESKQHSILMGELAVAEFEKDPTERTLMEKSLPLCLAGHKRAEMDATCFNDPSLEGSITQMTSTYLAALERIRKDTRNFNTEVIEHFKQDNAWITTVAKEILGRTMGYIDELPSPKWLDACGIQAFMEEGQKVCPQEQWSSKRTEFLQNYLRS